MSNNAPNDWIIYGFDSSGIFYEKKITYFHASCYHRRIDDRIWYAVLNIQLYAFRLCRTWFYNCERWTMQYGWERNWTHVRAIRPYCKPYILCIENGFVIHKVLLLNTFPQVFEFTFRVANGFFFQLSPQERCRKDLWIQNLIDIHL